MHKPFSSDGRDNIKCCKLIRNNSIILLLLLHIHRMILRIIIKQKNMMQKKSLVDEVVEHIRKQIEVGELNEEEKLPTELELMKLFGVGRSTLEKL